MQEKIYQGMTFQTLLIHLELIFNWQDTLDTSCPANFVMIPYCLSQNIPALNFQKKIIELLNDQADAAHLPHPKIIATAPTDKAASKLKHGSTIHRILGASNRSNQFRYNKENPVQCDVVIIDEASMIDIALMARLLETVPENARLIMLGDKNQLASVETGAVFGDICREKSCQTY